MNEAIVFTYCPDLSATLAPALTEVLGCDGETASVVVDDLERFLLLCAISREPLTPSRWIDEAWHLFLEDSERYEEYCRARCGKIILHVPQDDGTTLLANRQRAECLSSEVFGRPLDSIPGAIADCSNCNAGCCGRIDAN